MEHELLTAMNKFSAKGAAGVIMDIHSGEVLALLNSGAYSLAQMFQYNGRPLPAAVMVRDSGRVDLIRRRDTYEDLIAYDVW